MHRLPLVCIAVLFITGSLAAQLPKNLLNEIHKIKLLESSRDDVHRILAHYNTSGDNNYVQTYSNEEVDISVHFSTGTCSEDPEDDDETLTWKVPEGRVTRIEIEFNNGIVAKGTGLDLSKLTKEQTYAGVPDEHIHHSKTHGFAIETDDRGVKTIIFFPPASRLEWLCEANTVTKNFYSRKSWFEKKLEDRLVCEFINQPANVEEVILSATEVEATTSRTVSVTTIARDPENDVLVYDYKVDAGKIIGVGAKVIWDLTSVRPGNYMIIVGVDDSQGVVGRTVTKTVIVR